MHVTFCFVQATDEDNTWLSKCLALLFKYWLVNFIDRISIVQDFDHNYAHITRSSATTSVVRKCTRPFRGGRAVSRSY